MNSVEVRKVVKGFGDHIVLDNVNICFEKGKIHGIVGRNGSGKTVLLKCICGLMYVDQGEIYVNGKQVGKDVDIPEKVGAIIEVPGFLPHYSGYQNLKFLASINRMIGKSKIYETMELVGLDPTSDKNVGKYSLGMRQRLGIAQAIMEDPDILVLDEPMNGLDNAGVQDMRKLLLTIKQQGKTIILASHNREDIELLCDSVHEMDGGIMIK